MKTFRMMRQHDESEFSGTGEVLQGVIFDDATTVIKWTVPEKPSSIVIYKSFEDFKAIHVDQHPKNDTIIDFYEGKKCETFTQEKETKTVAWNLCMVRKDEDGVPLMTQCPMANPDGSCKEKRIPEFEPPDSICNG